MVTAALIVLPLLLQCSVLLAIILLVYTRTWINHRHNRNRSSHRVSNTRIYMYKDYNLTALCYLYLHVKHNNLAGSPIMLAPDMRRMDPNTLLLVRTSDQACLLARGATVRIRSTTTRRSVHLSTAVLGVEMRNYWNPRRTNCSRTLPDKLKNCTNYVETMVINVYRVGGGFRYQFGIPPYPLKFKMA